MGIVIRQSLKSSMVSFAGIMIGALGYIYVYPRFLEPEQIGVMRFVQDSAIVLAAVFQFNAPSNLVKFLPYVSVQDRPGFWRFMMLYPVPFIFLFAMILSLSKNIIAELYSENSAEVLEYFPHVFVLVIIIVYLNIVESFSKVNLRIVMPTLFREVFLRLFLFLVVGLFVLDVIHFPWIINMVVLGYALIFTPI